MSKIRTRATTILGLDGEGPSRNGAAKRQVQLRVPRGIEHVTRDGPSLTNIVA